MAFGANGDDMNVSDPDNYTTRQRLKQIYEARRDLRDMRRSASKARNRGSHNNKIRAVQHYRSGIESYLLEVDTLLRQIDPGPELWHEQDYGVIVVSPPGEWTEKRGYYEAEDINRRPHVPLSVESIPEPKEVPVTGLKWLFEAKSPVTRDFEFQVHGGRVHETVTKSAGAYISWQQLNQMVTDVNHFLGEIGIGLEMDDTDEWTI